AIRFAAYPEVEGVLGRLRNAGTKLVVVSNWDVSLHDVLRRTRIEPLVDAVITSAELGSRKPQAAIFAAGLELVGVGVGDALHVGDSVDEDVAGARAAGIDVVLL